MESVKCPKCTKEYDLISTECPGCGFKIKQYFNNLKKLKKENEEKGKQHLAEVRRIKKEKEEQEKRSREEQKNKITSCGACNYAISKRAEACPRCGEPQKSPEPFRSSQDEMELSRFADISFKTFLTPQLVRFFYIATLILGALSVLSTIIGSFWTGQFGLIIPAVISYALGVLFVRIVCESALILFKIEENTRK